MEDAVLPVEEIGALGLEVGPDVIRSQDRHPLVDQRGECPGDRLVVAIRPSLALGEAAEDGDQPPERLEQRSATQVDPRDAHVIAVMERGKRTGLDGLEELLVGHERASSTRNAGRQAQARYPRRTRTSTLRETPRCPTAESAMSTGLLVILVVACGPASEAPGATATAATSSPAGESPA